MQNKGLLIVIEGIDGSGKTTQINLLKDWLKHKGYEVIKSEWYRTKSIYELNMRLNLADEITAKTAFTLVAAEFAARLDYILKPALSAGKIILCEKYIYTPMAKDVARGATPEFVKLLYQDAPVPDIIFFLDVDVETALLRIRHTRRLQFWEAGMDMFMKDKGVKQALQLYYQGKLSQESMVEGFRRFQKRVVEEYRRLLNEYNMIVIDKDKTIQQQHAIIQQHVAELLMDKCCIRS
jgi:dTMP kinase